VRVEEALTPDLVEVLTRLGAWRTDWGLAEAGTCSTRPGTTGRRGA